MTKLYSKSTGYIMLDVSVTFCPRRHKNLMRYLDADVPAEYHCPDLASHDAATVYTLENMNSEPSVFYSLQTL